MTTLAQTIQPHLPYLRRFARSLTGSQKSGDAYVASVLETLVADPSAFPRDLAPRSGLYRLFLSCWSSLAVNGHSDPASGSLGFAERRLEAITPVARQAFLLVAVEGFSAQEAAKIVNIPAEDLERHLDTAAREIADQVATNILIIEDEPLIAIDLESVVTSIGHSVTGIARTKTEALAAFKARLPGLVLADIQLADGSSGLDAVNDMLGAAQVPVIFITAYPEQLLTGLRPEPTFLIPKPFQPEMVKAVISQALFFDLKAQPGTSDFKRSRAM